MTQAQHYEPADMRRLLLHTPVPRRKHDRWAAYSAFTNHVLPYVAIEHRDAVCRLAAGRFRV
mgnify:FL=1